MSSINNLVWNIIHDDDFTRIETSEYRGGYFIMTFKKEYRSGGGHNYIILSNQFIPGELLDIEGIVNLNDEPALFMAPKTKTVWVNLYLSANGNVACYDSANFKSQQFDSYNEARENTLPGCLKTISVEIPDDE